MRTSLPASLDVVTPAPARGRHFIGFRARGRYLAAAAIGVLFWGDFALFGTEFGAAWHRIGGVWGREMTGLCMVDARVFGGGRDAWAGGLVRGVALECAGVTAGQGDGGRGV